jgi:cellulose synthase/poly-beta-1,6-N-acetylglucosamine synthase-like glycosyltransferase
MLTISRKGIPEFFAKTKDYLRKNKDVATMGLIESDYDRWIKKNELTDDMIEEIKKEIKRFEYNPKISIIMPVYNVDQMWLEKAIDSVLNQLYENWELCIADDASTKKHVKQTLGTYSKRDKRIRVKYLQENQGISE